MKNKDKEKHVTVLGKETTFNGVMKFTDILHIEGTFTGNIDATGFLYVAKDAVCEVGHVDVASIVVEGTVRGNINATGDVELKSHSTVVGDIVALRLKIADDVSFSGAIHMRGGVPSTADDIFAMDVSTFRDSLKKYEKLQESSEHENTIDERLSATDEKTLSQEPTADMGCNQDSDASDNENTSDW